MAVSRQEQRAAYPLVAYNFRVTVGADTLSFARVSGLQRAHQTVTYQHGLSFLEGEQIAKYYLEKFVPVTLERGTTARGTFLHAWLEDRKPRAMEVSLCDEQGVPTVAWRIARALAVKLTAPTFDARSNEVAIDALEVRAAGITIVHLS